MSYLPDQVSQFSFGSSLRTQKSRGRGHWEALLYHPLLSREEELDL
jgi:hypothetical protein